MSLWMAETKRLGDEADMEHLTTEQFYAHKYIMGCSEEKLKTKLMELPDPTLEELTKVVINHERASAGKSQMEGAFSSSIASKIQEPLKQ